MFILDKLHKSILALEMSYSETEALLAQDDVSEVVKNTLRAGVIQNFEVAYEMCWKFLKRYLETNEDSATINSLVRKDLFRYAHGKNMLKDVSAWFDFHSLRNQSAHTYNEDTALDIYEIIPTFLIEALFLYDYLNADNSEC